MKEKDKTLIKNIAKGLFVFILFYYSSLFQLIPVLLFDIDLYNLSGSMSVMLSAFSSCVMVFILFFMYRKELTREWKIFKDNWDDNLYIGVKCWAAGLFVMLVANMVINMLSNGIAGNEETVQSMISSLPWLMLISAGILAPLNEEIIFRKCFRNVINNKWVFVIASGFVFGLMHVVGNVSNWVDILYIIPYGALGAAFAVSYDKTDTIFTPITFHMLHNIVLVIASIL